ncbi:hypothetical protein L1887_34490 [Cichorium endivia]|nr:hypothetical protein L1887_34490 [Cichorium endivia]
MLNLFYRSALKFGYFYWESCIGWNIGYLGIYVDLSQILSYMEDVKGRCRGNDGKIELLLFLFGKEKSLEQYIEQLVYTTVAKRRCGFSSLKYKPVAKF